MSKITKMLSLVAVLCMLCTVPVSADTFYETWLWTGQNGAVLSNSTNNAVVLTENSEDIVLTFGTNAITVSSSTGVTSLTFTSIALTIPGITSSGVLSVTDDTEASNTTTASLKTAGGLAVVKKMYIGGTGNIAGLLTAAGGIDTVGATNDITLKNDATIVNTSADLLTITEPTITLAGSTKINLDGATDVTGILTIDTAGSPADGIKISATTPTDGLEISSVCGTNAINISGAQTGTGITIASTFTKGITMGTTGGSGSTTAMGALSASWYGIEMSVSVSNASYEAHAIRAEIETTATAGNIMVARFDALASHSVGTLNGINATAQVLGDATLSGRVAAGYISLYGSSGTTVTRTANSIYGLFVQHLLYSDPGDATNPAGAGGVADFYNAGIGLSMPSGTYCDYGIVIKGETNGTVAALFIAPHGTTTWENGIRFSNGSPGNAGSSVSGGVTNAIYFDSQCPVVDLIKWEATGYGTGAVDVSDSITTQSGASTGAIKVDVAGTKYYIPIFQAGTQGAG